MFRKFLIVFLLSSFVISHSSFADQVLRFYGEEVVITASRLPQQLERSPWNVTVIKEDQIETFKAETLGEVLRFVPGIDVYATGGQGALVTERIKGSNASQVLVLIDGNRINSPLLGTADLGDIMLSDVERIEVVSSPLSAIYGSDAISGVINVITKKASTDSPFQAGLMVGSFGKYKLNFSTGNDGYLLSADYDKTNGFRTNSDYLGQKYAFSKYFGDFRLGVDYYTADKGVPGVPNAGDPTSASTPNNRQQDKNSNLYVDYQKEIGNSNLAAKVYQYSTEQKYHEYNFTTTAFSDYTYTTGQTGVTVQNSVELAKKTNVVLGLEYHRDQGVSSNIGTREVNSYAFYFGAANQKGPVTFDFGVRRDYHSQAGESISPRMGISLKPYSDLKLFTNFSTAFRAPTLNELYWSDPIWLMYGNANLLPERAIGIEMGLNKYIGDGSIFGLTLFARRVVNQILWEFNSTTFITQARNIGKVDVTGAELKNNIRLSEAVELFANATFQTALDVEDTTAANVGNDIPYSPRLKANLGLTCGDLAIIAKHVGERYSNAANSNKLSAYTVTDLTYSRKVGKVDLFAKVSNLFNADYAEAVGWHPVTYAITDYPMPGRNFAFGVGYEI